MRRVYLDHAATSPIRKEVLEAMCSAYTEVIGNASSLHTFGQQAKRTLEESRHRVASLLGADAKEIYFTPGGTVGDNLALRGVVKASAKPSPHIITSAIEHHAVLHTCHDLENQGVRVTYLPVSRTGIVDLQALEDALSSDTVLVSIMLANNETGTIQPLREVVELAHDRGVPVHTDAVQAIGKMSVDVDALGVDLLTLTAHKFNGPKGIGALYVRRDTPIAPILHGGHQERELCPGTENIAGVVGLAKALELAVAEMETESARLGTLRDRLERGLGQRIAGTALNGDPQHRLPNILNMSFAGTEGESLLLALDTQGIAVSTGSACSAGSTDPSHVLMAMGLGRNRAQASLRFSLGHGTSAEDIDYTIDQVAAAVEALRAIAPEPLRDF
ncbi:MAG: cysteine desulfurase [Chloroflexi bacterium]|nr:cysteine desulfurase [Chloroflexota bacterium]